MNVSVSRPSSAAAARRRRRWRSTSITAATAASPATTTPAAMPANMPTDVLLPAAAAVALLGVAGCGLAEASGGLPDAGGEVSVVGDGLKSVDEGLAVPAGELAVVGDGLAVGSALTPGEASGWALQSRDVKRAASVSA